MSSADERNEDYPDTPSDQEDQLDPKEMGDIIIDNTENSESPFTMARNRRYPKTAAATRRNRVANEQNPKVTHPTGKAPTSNSINTNTTGVNNYFAPL